MFELIIDGKYRELYPSMVSAINRVHKLIMASSGVPQLLENFEIQDSYFYDTLYRKRVVWKFPLFQINIMIKQLSKGNINITLLKGVINATLKNTNGRR